jgi:hypothetical protein
MRNKARFLLSYQASAFAAEANVYAPFYRQYDARHLLTLDINERINLVRKDPWDDVLAAFTHYLIHNGEERPFLLVGHSQGAMLIKELLYCFLENRPDLVARLVAAYIIGFSVSRSELDSHPVFPFAHEPDDTGVIISYNTEAPGLTTENPTVIPSAVAINPITWTTGESLAPSEQSAGSFIIDRLGKLRRLEKLADAQVNRARGSVICSTFDQELFYGPGFEMINPFPLGILHIYDIALYYYDLKLNAVIRGQRFFQRHIRK